VLGRSSALAAHPATPADTSALAAPRTTATRVLGACLLLLVIYVAVAAFNDTRGTIVSDTGGKLATLRVMEERGTVVPDVGYWAQRYDPRGSLHPLVFTRRVGDRYVQVSTLPMVEAAYPLYELGGTRAALLLPMLGAVLTALGARALTRRLTPSSGWTTFWAVGLATPVAIYALDFWEHSIGLALMMWAVVVLGDVIEQRPGWRAGWRGALVVGALFGAAATMRTEALVYLVAATGVGCLIILRQQRGVARALRTGCLVLAGAAVPLALNTILERLILGGDLRTGRTASVAAGSGAAAGTRVPEALTSSVGVGMAHLRPSADWLFGALTVALVGSAALALRSAERRLRLLGAAAAGAAFLVYLLRFGSGLGFVPGLLVASPLAAAGLFVAWRDRRTRAPALVACAALPLVWVAQYTGSMWPQWGGRYVLISGVLLAVCACAVLRTAPRALLTICLLAGFVTGAGLVWLNVRTHTNADGMETILARDDEVLIARHAQLFREVGAFYTPSRHWLTAATDAQLDDAVRVARKSGAREFATIGPEGQDIPQRLGGYVRRATQLVPFTRPDVRVQVTTYALPS
jgi:hypothetical protein